MDVSTVATGLAEGRVDDQVLSVVGRERESRSDTWPGQSQKLWGGRWGGERSEPQGPGEEGCQIARHRVSVLGMGIREGWCCRSLTKEDLPPL